MHCGLWQCAQQLLALQSLQMGLRQPSHAQGSPCLRHVASEHTEQVLTLPSAHAAQNSSLQLQQEIMTPHLTSP